MSSRSFRDRYAAFDRAAATSTARVEDHTVVWPLPRGGRETATSDGVCVVNDRFFSDPSIIEARDAFERCVAAFGSRYLAPDDLLFLDTETTGLSGGTGTHVFLVGIGRFVGDAFHIRQFFMRHPGDERAVLAALASDLTRAGALVTYNGRAFDVPLLETRYTLHGRAFERPDVHIDLLAPARAIWKHRLPNCSLGTIEQLVLGVTREVDAPGWMIPQLYFDYLRTRQIELLEPVFEHNRSDIMSLARLAALVHLWEAGLDTPTHDIDRLAVALHRLRRGFSERALDDLDGLWESPSIPADFRLRALRTLSTMLKRARRDAEALAVWQRAMTDPSRAVRLFACEELAKHLEHRSRDHILAWEVARRGADGAALAGDEAAAMAFSRRLRRLERKLHGAAGAPAEEPFTGLEES